MANKQEKTRYSDQELQEFKELILAKIEQAEENYKRLTDTIMVDESDPTFKMLEEGAATLQKEVSSQQAQRQLDFIRKLQAALVRIENKTYGVCRITGKLIPKERLLAVPHATLSIEGKEIEAQRKKKS
ncbi:MAG: TraR/DksA C4-type zinc finger protein [Muribaculaceae bacterium]|jgi:RNA polymerase-binding transcription factor DksA|nr:TraR/DksA C4-type zinc finger protein [Muribaculaceae bacterium]